MRNAMNTFIRRRRAWLGLLVAAMLLAAAAVVVLPRGSSPPRTTTAMARAAYVVCNKYASPGSSRDAGNGSARHPFHSLQRLDRALAPGQTGCLRSGTYGSIHATHQLTRSGTATARITITGAPGARVTVKGWVVIQGSDTTLEHVRIDGSNVFNHQPQSGCPYGVSESLDIVGHGDTLQYDDYFQSIARLRSTGIGVGFWGDADDTTIRYNRIHDVGLCRAFDHLIYLSHGNHVRIYGNWMWDDPHGDGVQLYPGPTNARIFSNVIYQAGEGFVIGDVPGESTNGNRIFHNVVANSTGLPADRIRGDAIHVYWAGSPGTDNAFTNNLLFHDPGGRGHLTTVVSHSNHQGDPDFANAGGHDFRVGPHSPAAGWHLWDGVVPRLRLGVRKS